MNQAITITQWLSSHWDGKYTTLLRLILDYRAFTGIGALDAKYRATAQASIELLEAGIYLLKHTNIGQSTVVQTLIDELEATFYPN